LRGRKKSSRREKLGEESEREKLSMKKRKKMERIF